MSNLCQMLPTAAPNIAPRSIAEARALIGKRVELLRSCDVDKSGRNYIFPKRGTVTEARGRCLRISFTGDWVNRNDIVEMRELNEGEM